MKIEEMTRADCSGCEACANICPRNAIVMIRDVEGFAYPKINRKLCIACGRCDLTCPALNLKKKIPQAFPKVFAAINPDEKIRRHSTSGGAFTALSKIFLRGGGIIFGAGFDENFHVRHMSAKTFDELENLRGSKYVQSQIGDVYRQVSGALKSKAVLFSGTPCQCAGLKNFLGVDPENLLTVDIICHGTPSPALWECYIGELGHGNEISHVNFRSKRDGWSTSNVEINFFNRPRYFCPLNKETYGKLFLHGLIERPSCHRCKFKFPNGQADLTLGDAWGVKNFAPEMFDNRGTSLILVHTSKGKKFFEHTNLHVQQVSLPDALKKNPRLIAPSIADPRRGNFFSDYANAEDKFAVIQKYFHKDDKTLRPQIDAYDKLNVAKRYQSIAAQIRQQFEKNILVVISSNEQKFFANYFEQQFPNCGIYSLQPQEDKFICLEKFSSIVFTLKDFAALNDFAKRFNVAEIFAERSLIIDSPPIKNWLDTCNLPIKIFSRANDSA